jgi:P27 family predicted phage terminase small subunit
VANPHRRPSLAVIREGNPGHRAKRDLEGLRLPPAELEEPDWVDTFPVVGGGEEVAAANERCRAVASREWRRVVPVLRNTAGLTAVDAAVLHDFCVCVARLDQCEREISSRGMVVLGERGWQKNGATTIAGQYRSQLARYVGELGLSPSSRARMPARPDGDDDGDDDPFD